MSTVCDLVVSAENTCYMAWQCMLFWHSCRTHLGRDPIFVVHGDAAPLAAGFAEIARHGGQIQRAPNFRDSGSDRSPSYPPRNAIHSLALVRSDADCLALFDPDMLFLRPIDFDGLARQLAADEITLDRVAYLQLERGFQEPIRSVCYATGIDLAAVAQQGLSGGVPHLVPNRLRQPLCRDWLSLTDRCREALVSAHGAESSAAWVAVMWGLVLAIHKQALKARLTDFCISNAGNPTLPDAPGTGPAMIHYCYCHASWSKRRFLGSADACDAVWNSTAPAGTVNGAICRQLADAARAFGIG
ncbi:MAG: hypothetical protein EA400_16155 [Chromatiaceae bacterium]|nr:MAG: hypothetical protein EA400_16155 [Chromatiaceae bacterium]